MNFLQEIHSDFNYETDWKFWWILFSPSVKAKCLFKEEIEPGGLLAVRVEINDLCSVFINMYTPNGGSDRSNCRIF